MRLIKTLLLLMTGLLLMGNKGCDQPAPVEPPKARELKFIVDVGLVKSAMIDMPGGQKFDFEFVVNQQIYPVLEKSEGFAFRYEPPFADTSSQLGSNIEFRNLNLSRNDMDLFERSFAGKVPNSVPSDEISCLVNQPQYRLSGSVNAFELLSRIGLGLGFNPAGVLPAAGIIGINFEVENYQLDMSLIATLPLTNHEVAATNVTSAQTRTQVEFNLPIQNLLINPSYYHQTPLARVSYGALDKAVNQIREQIRTKKLEWYTRVLFADEHAAVILAGKVHNVKEGDIFNIYNEKTFWGSRHGEIPVPCESQYLTSVDGEKIATIVITEVTDTTAFGKITYTSGRNVKMGAKVKIQKLNEPDPTKLASASGK